MRREEQQNEREKEKEEEEKPSLHKLIQLVRMEEPCRPLLNISQTSDECRKRQQDAKIKTNEQKMHV